MMLCFYSSCECKDRQKVRTSQEISYFLYVFGWPLWVSNVFASSKMAGNASICIFSAFYCKNSRNCDKSCSTNRLKLKIRLKVQLVQKNINNCEYQKITITKQIKNRLTRTKSHFGDLVKAPPTLKSSCFFHIKLF